MLKEKERERNENSWLLKKSDLLTFVCVVCIVSFMFQKEKKLFVIFMLHVLFPYDDEKSVS